MNKIRKSVVLILALILMAGTSGLTACSGGSEGLTIDGPAPSFKLNDLDGQPVSLSNFKGKLIFLNFWNSNASTCVKERKYFQELYDSWSGRNDIVLLTITTGEEQETVKSFMESNKYTFPVLLDTQYEVIGKYDVQYVPTSILIGKDGRIKLNTIGDFKSKEAIEKQLASFMS